MKIVIGGTRGIPARYGGFETSAQETATRLKELGHDVSVYCRRKGNEAETEYNGVKLVCLPAPKVNSFETIFHSIYVAMHVIFIQRDVDVVHFYNAASSFGGLLLRLSGIPLVMTLDGVEWRREKWNWLARLIWRVATALSIRISDVTVCDSDTVRSFFEERYGTELHYVPYGAKSIRSSTEAFKQFGLQPKGYLLFVGRLVPEKGVDTLLVAYKLSGCTLPLVIVGDNKGDREYVEALRQQAVGDVRFLGFQYGSDYESILTNASFYVSASKLEGTSPSLLAAMGAQVCCLVNGILENRETGGDAVAYFDGTAEDLARQMVRMIADPNEVDRLAQAAFTHVCEKYDWDVVTDQYVETYRAAVTPHGSSLLTHRRM